LSSTSPSSDGSGGGDSASSTVGHRLPATGADVWLLALVGLGLVLTGAGLRVRLEETEPAPGA
ncbi:MAG: hypothetical protein QOD76_818, partial [Solirubrobacteraceae bacterium]|nr:hypothetical protein [Solirubrobacteraceae bacterium]